MTAIALKLSRRFTTRTAVWSPRRTTPLSRTLAHHWDLVTALSLIASSVAYSVWTLSHLA